MLRLLLAFQLAQAGSPGRIQVLDAKGRQATVKARSGYFAGGK